jgi:hypothetical protein
VLRLRARPLSARRRAGHRRLDGGFVANLSATGVGIAFMVTRHFDAIDAEFALAEGGDMTLEDRKLTRIAIGTTEKVPRRFRLIATSRGLFAITPAAKRDSTDYRFAFVESGCT